MSLPSLSMRHVSVSRRLATIVFSLLLITFVHEGCAQDNKTVPKDAVCFTPQDSYRLVTDLENAKNFENLNLQLEKQTVEQMNQIEAYKELVKLMEDKVKAAEELAANQEKIYKDAMAKNEELYKAKEEALKKDLKEAGKTDWGSLIRSFGVGAGVTALLVLIL